MESFDFVISCLYFYLPAAFANIGASLGKFVPGFNRLTFPVDFGKMYKGKRLVGDHKTIGGYLFGVLFGVVVALVRLLFLDRYFERYILFDLSLPVSIFLYFVMANGALLGDIVKSIAKRLANIPPHSAWIPFDEIDHSVTAMLLAMIFVPVTFKIYVTVVILYMFLHIIANLLGYVLKIKKVPY